MFQRSWPGPSHAIRWPLGARSGSRLDADSRWADHRSNGADLVLPMLVPATSGTARRTSPTPSPWACSDATRSANPSLARLRSMLFRWPRSRSFSEVAPGRRRRAATVPGRASGRTPVSDLVGEKPEKKSFSGALHALANSSIPVLNCSTKYRPPTFCRDCSFRKPSTLHLPQEKGWAKPMTAFLN